MKTKVYTLAVMMAAALFVTGCKKDAPKVEQDLTLKSITIDRDELFLEVGATQLLTAKLLPENVVDKTIIWSSSDKAIATVDADGLVTALAKGNAIITAKSGDKEDTCPVTTEFIAATSISFEGYPVFVPADEWDEDPGVDVAIKTTYPLNVKILPANASDKKVTFEVETYKSAVSVSEQGLVTANEYAYGVKVTAKVGTVSCTAVINVVTPAGEANLGDFYYSDGTHSAWNAFDVSKVCVGVVVAPKWSVSKEYGDKGAVTASHTNGDKVMVVSLEEGKDLAWSTEATATAATDFDGAKNMAKLIALDPTLDKFPAAKWCSDKGAGWYLPSHMELRWIFEGDIAYYLKTKNIIKINCIDANSEKYPGAVGFARSGNFYWCSDEKSADTAFSYGFAIGGTTKTAIEDIGKNKACVRAVKLF